MIMPRLAYFNKDILSDIDPNVRTLLIHQCNCLRIMGAGIAKQLRHKYPGVYEADLDTAKGDASKLGTYSLYKVSDNFVILNCYAQYGIYSKDDRCLTKYDALHKCFCSIRENYEGWTIRTPRIGCGLAKGDWTVVEGMLLELAQHNDVEVYSI